MMWNLLLWIKRPVVYKERFTHCNVWCVSSASNHRRRNEGTPRQDI